MNSGRETPATMDSRAETQRRRDENGIEETDFLSLLFSFSFASSASRPAAKISSARCGISSALILLFSVYLRACPWPVAGRRRPSGRTPRAGTRRASTPLGPGPSARRWPRLRHARRAQAPARHGPADRMPRVAAGPTASDAEGHAVAGSSAAIASPVTASPATAPARARRVGPLSPRLSRRPVQVHLDGRRRQARLVRTWSARCAAACPAPPCRPSTRWRPRRSTPWSSTSSI